MVKVPMASLKQKESEWKQERQSLLEQLKLAFDRQFAKRSEALKPTMNLKVTSSTKLSVKPPRKKFSEL